MSLSWRTEYVRLGIDRVDREIAEVEAEIDGFKSFYREVEGVSTTEIGPLSDRSVLSLSESRQTGKSKIQTAYQQNVMHLDHYDEEYNDTFEESFTSEFGPAGVQVLANDVVTHTLKLNLLQSCQSVIERRNEYKSMLQVERDTLEEMNKDLIDLGNRALSMSNSGNSRCDFAKLQTQCDQLAQQRQRQLRSTYTSNPHRFDCDNMIPYLYQSLPVTYPILADIATVGSHL